MAGIAVKLRCSVVHKIGLPPAVSQPASISFPQWGHFIRKPPPKEKTPCLLSKRQSVQNTLRYHSSCRPLAGGGPSRPLPRADAVTGINRPRLLGSPFSRRLQGDFPPPPHAASHQPAALFAAARGLLVLIHAKLCTFLPYYIPFPPFVNANPGKMRRPGPLFHAAAGLPSALPLFCLNFFEF